MTDHDSTIPLKKCKKCGKEYPATSEFFRLDRKWLLNACKDCERSQKRKYSREHREHTHDYWRAYYETHRVRIRAEQKKTYSENAERIREVRRVQRLENIDESRRRGRQAYWKDVETTRKKRREYSREYRAKNPEKVRKIAREWVKRNPEKTRVFGQTRRARERCATGKFTLSDVDRQKAMQTDKRGRLCCWWCGCVISEYQIDHRIPLVKGGSNAPDNICLACPNCNRHKHDKLPHEWNGRLL